MKAENLEVVSEFINAYKGVVFSTCLFWDAVPEISYELEVQVMIWNFGIHLGYILSSTDARDPSLRSYKLEILTSYKCISIESFTKPGLTYTHDW